MVSRMSERISVTVEAVVRGERILELYVPGEVRPFLSEAVHLDPAGDPEGVRELAHGALRRAALDQRDLAVHAATVRGEKPRVVGPDRTSPED